MGPLREEVLHNHLPSLARWNVFYLFAFGDLTLVFIDVSAWVLFYLCVLSTVYLSVCAAGQLSACAKRSSCPIKGVTLPVYAVVEFFGLSNLLSLLPLLLLLSFHVPETLSMPRSLRDVHRSTRVCGMLQEESGTRWANYRGNSTGSHGAGWPSVNAESEIFQLFELGGGLRTWAGKKW